MDFLCSGYPNERRHELDWSTRLSIVKHIAEELVFLHEVKQPSTLEWDIKAKNIFLDNDLNPKIVDFASQLASFHANGRDIDYTIVIRRKRYLLY